MSAVTASLCSTLLFVGLFVFVSAAPLSDKKIIAQSGEDVTLTCRAPNKNIMVVEWSRADLGEEYVLLYRDEHFDPVNQHPSFKNRVDLQDRQIKDGDVSLILKDVRTDDAGTYECRVVTIRRKRANLSSNPISIIYLHVVPPGEHTTTPPPTSTPPPGSTHITLPPSLSLPVLSVLSCVGSVCVVVLLVLLVPLVRRCVHRKPEEDGEDEIIHSTIKISNHPQQPIKPRRDIYSAVVYSAVRTEDVGYGQTTIRTRRPRL
ncbi:uncharacterized protein LOC120716468 isoform X2 [Simochromis diagramma]|uniref:uncharacterized protein LOC120716468 isoform X2 n=1 Tax=Simochromis diagramma TaxID=43689 RepID=UPI001A7EAB67|nr:uncharacterized protein LOC120716468 isoform X2 [Simochromis diagramma]